MLVQLNASLIKKSKRKNENRRQICKKTTLSHISLFEIRIFRICGCMIFKDKDTCVWVRQCVTFCLSTPPPGVRPLPRRVEISKLIQTFLDVYYGYSWCQKQQRLLSGTTSVLLDSLDDALENPWVRPLSRRVEFWKLIASLMYIRYIHYVKNQQDSSQEPPASS